MRRPRILLDCDGILADFTTAALGLVNEKCGHTHVADEVTDWDVFQFVCDPKKYKPLAYKAIQKKGFCSSIPVFPEAIAAVAALQEYADVYIVTSPFNSPYWVIEREQWLRTHFGIPHKKVIHTSAKYAVVGELFIDDKPSNVQDWVKHHPRGTGILWDAHHNRRPEHRDPLPEFVPCTSNWDEVLEIAADVISGSPTVSIH